MPPPERDEVVAVHAQLERPLVAVDRGAPGILGVGRLSPGAMLPDDVQVAEVERGRLGVGDVRLALLVDQDAAGRGDPLGPAQAEHPAHHVEHVDAHVAHDAVAVLHERPPAAGMDDRIVGPHRGRAGPHLVVEVFGRRTVGRVGIISHVIIAIDLDQADLAELALADDPVAGLDRGGACSGAGCPPGRPAGACARRRPWPGPRPRPR